MVFGGLKWFRGVCLYAFDEACYIPNIEVFEWNNTERYTTQRMPTDDDDDDDDGW